MEAASPSKTLSGAGPARLHCGWDVPRRPRPAPPAVARPARAAALPRPGTRGDATPCADRPDRRPLALRAHAGAHGRHGTLPRAARPAPGLAAHADERRSAHLHAGLPDVGHVRRAAGHPRLPLPRQAPPRRRVLPARAGRPAGRGGAGAGPPRHPRRRQRLRLRLHGRRHEQPPDVRDDAAAERRGPALPRLAARRRRLGPREVLRALRDRARPRPPPLRRRPPRGERAGMALARHQGRDLGVAPRAVHAGRRARPVRGRAGGLRELPRLRRVRARLRPASPTRAPRPPSHRPLDPPALARAAARPGAPLRPLRPLRPRPGAVHAVRAPLRREAHRADPLRRLPRSARGARGAGARRSRAARRARARRVSDAPRAGVLPAIRELPRA